MKAVGKLTDTTILIIKPIQVPTHVPETRRALQFYKSHLRSNLSRFNYQKSTVDIGFFFLSLMYMNTGRLFVFWLVA